MTPAFVLKKNQKNLTNKGGYLFFFKSEVAGTLICTCLSGQLKIKKELNGFRRKPQFTSHKRIVVPKARDFTSFKAKMLPCIPYLQGLEKRFECVVAGTTWKKERQRVKSVVFLSPCFYYISLSKSWCLLFFCVSL